MPAPKMSVQFCANAMLKSIYNKVQVLQKITNSPLPLQVNSSHAPPPPPTTELTE
jgi:Ni,Fe-hydrogenase III small subunit